MGYIKEMRRLIGHATLFTVGCGVILERDGCILLQHRMDEDNWCIPGGMMEIGETFEEAAIREIYEETNLAVHDLQLFGIYSGADCFVEYPNQDKVYSVQIIFQSTNFTGDLKQQDIESKEHRFFKGDELPASLNPRQKRFIQDWAEGKALPIIN